jgi:hypothetical protein
LKKSFGFLMLDAGYWILDAGYWILDAGYWMPDTGCWMLDTEKPATCDLHSLFTGKLILLQHFIFCDERYEKCSGEKS